MKSDLQRILVLSVWLLGATANAQFTVETLLHSFQAGFNDGASPYSSVIRGTDGRLYGTTWGGGANAAGTVFMLDPTGGGYTILHQFTNSTDGSTPFSRLVQGTDGFLYGTTYYGGTADAGTIFKLNTNGAGYSVLYSFTNHPDGANPRGGLIQGKDGGFYGTTYGGGGSNLGTVFRINGDGSGYSVLYSFRGFPDAETPFAALIQGLDGALYGTTFAGGTNVIGTVFTLRTNGSSYAILHHFGQPHDGFSYEAELLQGSDGALYGTTVSGGSNGFGTVFKLNTDGSGYTTLHHFTNSPDGANSYAGLVQGLDGALYGTTDWGGSTNAGTLFRLNPDGGNYSVIHHFSAVAPDGSHPFAALTGGNGLFYGTTLQGGGTFAFGTVFRLALVPGLHLGWNAQGAAISLTGVPGQACLLLGSTNFTDWEVLTSLTLTNGAAYFSESGAKNLPARFYRAQVR
jgi:uncharacterized repeat protein (TIGR03803 family)